MSERSLFNTRSIRRMIIPLIFEQLMIVLVALVDTMLLSGIHESALAAFSLVDSINLLLMQVFMAIGAGGSIIAAQYLGSRDRKGAERTATQSAMMVLLISLVIALPTAVFNGPLLSLIYPRVSPHIMGFARQYLLLSAISYPLYALYNCGTSLLYAQGYSKLSMLTSMAMNSLKIILNFFLIRVLHTDIIGAGLATILSRLVGAFMVTRFLMDQQAPIHYSKLSKIRLEFAMDKRIFKVALPSGLENLIFLSSKLIIGIMIATYSGTMIAANAAANTISTYLSVPGNAISLVSVTVVSQSIGAAQKEEAKRFTKNLMLTTFASFLGMALLIAAFLHPIVNMLNLSPEAAKLTREIMLIYCVVSVLGWAPAFGLPNALRAAGDNRFVMLAASLSVVLVRLGGSFLFGNALNLKVHGIWIAMYLDWAVRAGFFLYRFKSGKWLTRRLV